MPSVVGQARLWWEQGPFVFVVDGEPVGRARVVLNLDQRFAAGERRHFQDVPVNGMDEHLARWTSGRTGTEASDFVVGDVRKGRWFKLRGAFVRRDGDAPVWTVSSIEPSEPPVR